MAHGRATRALLVGAMTCSGVAAGLFALGQARRAEAQPASGAAPSSATPRAVYLRDCAVCHGADARGTVYGPTLQGVGRAAVDYWVSTGRMPLTRRGRPARSPQGTAPPGQYAPDPGAEIHRNTPSYSPDEIRALVDYVVSIAPGGPDVPALDPARADLANGGELFRAQCAACHAWSGVGGALYQRAAPGVHDATPTQVAEAVRTGPGQMPAFGPAALTPQQLDDVVAYVRYLDHPDDRGGHPLWFVGPVIEGAVAVVLGLGALLAVTRLIGTRA